MDWFGRKRRKFSEDALALTEEATALLTGHIMTVALRAGTGTPAWAQVNFLAHGRPALLLRQFELEQQRLPHRIGSWPRTKSDILQELVVLAAGRPERIEVLQRGCLIPVEIRLMESSSITVQPSDVLALALALLHAHPLGLHHRMLLPPES